MSAFLGPIHYWLYNKIRLQQAVVDKLCLIGNPLGLKLQEECEERYGQFLNKPLEEMIDQGNIHGWLQERVSQVEYKYAYAVTKLTAAAPDIIEQLKGCLYLTGSEQAEAVKTSEVQKDARKLFTLLTDQLLDGMPCDHTNRVIAQTETEVTWTRNLCVHTPYWEEVGGDIALYYTLREAWMKGFFQEFGYQLEKTDDASYRIHAEI